MSLIVESPEGYLRLVADVLVNHKQGIQGNEGRDTRSRILDALFQKACKHQRKCSQLSTCVFRHNSLGTSQEQVRQGKISTIITRVLDILDSSPQFPHPIQLAYDHIRFTHNASLEKAGQKDATFQRLGAYYDQGYLKKFFAQVSLALQQGPFLRSPQTPQIPKPALAVLANPSPPQSQPPLPPALAVLANPSPQPPQPPPPALAVVATQSPPTVVAAQPLPALVVPQQSQGQTVTIIYVISEKSQVPAVPIQQPTSPKKEKPPADASKPPLLPICRQRPVPSEKEEEPLADESEKEEEPPADGPESPLLPVYGQGPAPEEEKKQVDNSAPSFSKEDWQNYFNAFPQ